jgi:hypothetical protein
MSTSEHQKAIERLDGARREERRLSREHGAAEGSPGLSAQTELRGARDESAARARWLEWIEADEPQGAIRA